MGDKSPKQQKRNATQKTTESNAKEQKRKAAAPAPAPVKPKK